MRNATPKGRVLSLYDAYLFLAFYFLIKLPKSVRTLRFYPITPHVKKFSDSLFLYFLLKTTIPSDFFVTL